MDLMQLNGAEIYSSALCLSLVLDDPLAVSGTEYKVLRSQGSGRFVPCVCSRLNGRCRLTYLTRTYITLREYAAAQAPEDVSRLLAGGVESLLALKDNGFLSLQNAVFSEDLLFVDRKDKCLQLIYVPMARSVSGGDLETARQAYRVCARILGSVCGPGSPLRGFESTTEYRDGDLAALMGLLGRLVPSASAGARLAALPDEPEAERGAAPMGARASVVACHAGQTWVLVAASSSHEVYEVPAGGGVMGKSPSRATVVISMSPAVSRAHCRVLPENDRLVVVDLGSANGTFVNGARVAKGDSAELREGDRLRLADVQFTVQRG